MAKRWLLFLYLIALPLLFAGYCHRGFTDNEGMYAEIGREILLSGDWLTPHINGGVYLNKPPLLFWLTALVLRVTGLNELPRLISGLATLATMLLIADLGRRIWPRQRAAGVWAAAVYLSRALTVVEARILRPDSLLTFFITLTLWGLVRVDSRSRASDHLGIAAIWSGIGLGVMTKGLIGALVPALVLFPALLLGRPKELRRYCPLWGLLLAAAIVLPWHLAAGIVNPGFGWDYVVNQHLLYFFDRKFPRDSIPHPLWFAWAAFAGRLAPWVLLLPAAVASQLRRARAERTVTAWLPLTWFGMIWLFFSLSKGRLEHYFLPAVPAAALLVGRLCEEWSRGDRVSGIAGWALTLTPTLTLTPRRGFSVTCRNKRKSKSGSRSLAPGPLPRAQRLRALPFLLLCLTAVGGLLAAPSLLRTSGVLGTAPELLPIAEGAFTVVALGTLAATFLAFAQRLSLALGTLVATFLLFGLFACRGTDATDTLVSSRRLIASIDPSLLSQSTVAYETGTEYQLCGGLNFYLQRRLLILKPHNFIPPTYLEHSVDRLFVNPDRFWKEWRQGDRRFLLFSDPSFPRERAGDFPQPCFEVGRGGGRLLVTNLSSERRLASRMTRN